MGAGPGEAADNFIAGGDGFVDLPMDVGEGRAHHRDDVFEALAALLLTRQRVELDEVFFDDFVAHIEAALVDDLFYEPV